MNRFTLLCVLGVSVLSAAATPLVSTNAVWKYRKGLSEASSPDATAWRNVNFDDSGWAAGQAPFFYENDPTSSTAYSGNTDLTDMYGGYTCIFMREKFVVPDPSQVNQLQLPARSDDGFIAWINGTEVARFNMPSGNVAYNGSSLPALAEPVPTENYTLNGVQNFLTPGTNVLTIQAFNSSLSASSDFLIWAGLTDETNAGWTSVGISEFMATNVTTVADVDGDFSPWIELFNPTASDVSLNGWSLSIDPNNLRQWVFPNITLEANSFIVVYASGKNRTSATAELHTNFRLPVNGGYLVLADAGNNIVSSFTAYPAQQPDISYGRDQATPTLTGFFPTPTPDDANTMGGANAAPPVTFARGGGTFVDAFTLQLSAASNAPIYFTLDGAPPTQESTLYDGGISITGSVQVRARAFLPGMRPGALQSQTYIQLDPGLARTNSNLPAVVIYNFGAGAVPVDDYQFVNMAFYEPQNGVTSLTNAPTLNMRAGIHLHGSSTLDLPKHAFAVSFWDEDNFDADYAPLGMPKESDWILYAPDNFEPVLIHNPLAYQLGNDAGHYAPRTRFVEVYINQDGGALAPAHYNGIYVLEEKIKWDKNRVDVTKIHSVDELHPLDNIAPNVTGAYMMKIDRLGDGETGFVGAGMNIVYDHPNEEDIKTPQRAPQQAYLQNYMDTFGAALNSPNFTNPTNGYRAFIDMPSWIDAHILNATPFNLDMLRLSAYFYKDRSDVLHFGPLWDFDRSQGSADGRDFNPRVWRSRTGDMGTDDFNYPWWGRMFTDADFWQAWIDRYQDLRGNVLSTNHIFGLIDSFTAQLRQEEPREAARWPSLTQPRSGSVSIDGYSYTFPGTYQGEIDFLKKWYTDRLNFMDTNFVSQPVFSKNAGYFLPGDKLTLTTPTGGLIFYTTNNTDPRAVGGGISTNALTYTTPISLSSNLIVTARVLNNAHHNLTGANNPPLSSSWSGSNTATYAAAAAPVITQSPANLDAYLGQAPVFSVTATANPAPGYQWQFQGTNLPNQTNARFTNALTSAAQTGVYTVVVTNLAGTNSASFGLNVTAKPHLAVTEVLSSESKGTVNSTLDHQDWWELSNLGDFAVNLQGYRFDDNHALLSDAAVVTNAVSIAPGESIVLVNGMTLAQFQAWWGASNLPPSLQLINYPKIGFSANGDAIYLWNAAAMTDTDIVTSVTFPAATRGVTFGYNPDTGVFGALSVAGSDGAFSAPSNGDIGSPGTLITLPRLSQAQANTTAGFQFNLATQPNRNYQIQYKDDLNETVWQVFTNFKAVSGSFTLTDSSLATNATRYYRVMLTP
ncbi:MAG TPA: CotH kinase family protein [Verrucomicrobiae bacterium]|jgi:hypothetical protein|nr:CotH kinase family protein [Verrucomicrobiae bacterium]